MKKKWAERFLSLFLMALAASAYWECLKLPKPVTGLRGPAYFPEMLSILLFICSAIPLVKSFIQTGEDKEKLIIQSPQLLAQLMGLLAFIGGMLLIFPYTGWLLGQLLLVFIIEFAFEKKKWTVSLAFSVVTTVIIYGMFELGLGISLPKGFFE